MIFINVVLEVYSIQFSIQFTIRNAKKKEKLSIGDLRLKGIICQTCYAM